VGCLVLAIWILDAGCRRADCQLCLVYNQDLDSGLQRLLIRRGAAFKALLPLAAADTSGPGADGVGPMSGVFRLGVSGVFRLGIVRSLPAAGARVSPTPLSQPLCNRPPSNFLALGTHIHSARKTPSTRPCSPPCLRRAGFPLTSRQIRCRASRRRRVGNAGVTPYLRPGLDRADVLDSRLKRKCQRELPSCSLVLLPPQYEARPPARS
jgi:hypothetical protein